MSEIDDIRERDASSGDLWFTGPASFTAQGARDRRALLTEIDRLRQDVLFEQERIAAFLEERDRLRGLLRSIACISHDGGLIRASQWEALVAIRRLTLAHWDKTGTREEHKGRCAAAFGEADATADQPPAVLDDCAAPPAKGDYVLATKYDDGDPGDQWSVGFYDRTDERGRHYVTDADGKQFRGNGFRRVERIGPGRGAWLLERAQLIASSDRSLWDWARDPMRAAGNSPAATPPATAWPGPWGLCADGMPHTPRPRSEPMACGRCGNELSADKFFDEAVALKARLAEAEQDIEQWKKVYDLRGRALQRPCINCGYVPQVIRPADSADEVQP